MVRVDVRYLTGVRFEAEARGHRVISDQPIGKGGQDTGMTPPEFLLTSLATCVGYYAAEYLKIHGLPANGVGVRVEAEKGANPVRLATFHIEVTVPAPGEALREGVLKAVKKCLIHNTLLGSPDITIGVHTAQAPVLAAA
jgi:putative redox protein